MLWQTGKGSTPRRKSGLPAEPPLFLSYYRLFSMQVNLRSHQRVAGRAMEAEAEFLTDALHDMILRKYVGGHADGNSDFILVDALSFSLRILNYAFMLRI